MSEDTKTAHSVKNKTKKQWITAGAMLYTSPSVMNFGLIVLLQGLENFYKTQKDIEKLQQ